MLENPLTHIPVSSESSAATIFDWNSTKSRVVCLEQIIIPLWRSKKNTIGPARSIPTFSYTMGSGDATTILQTSHTYARRISHFLAPQCSTFIMILDSYNFSIAIIDQHKRSDPSSPKYPIIHLKQQADTG